jgi:hypothetical protein
MKYPMIIHYLLLASFILIISGQDWKNWSDFSLLRQWLMGTGIIIFLVHLLLIVVIHIKAYKKVHN